MNPISLRQLGPLSRRLLAAQAGRDLAALDLIRPPASSVCEGCRDELHAEMSFGRFHRACLDRLLAA